MMLPRLDHGGYRADLAEMPLEDLQFELGAVPVAELLARAQAATLAGHGVTVTYSRKVFIPLTRLCRDVCHYCTFAAAPRRLGHAYLSCEQAVRIAHQGVAAGCREALFTLGDRPEGRYAVARSVLASLGHDSTFSYLREVANTVYQETGLLPHLNPGVMSEADLRLLRPVAASMGMMLESLSPRLSAPGGPHHGSPDKAPARRLAALESAGRARIPFTTGLLIGIGETRAERIETLIAIRDSHRRHGHVQEVIIQNFRAKPGTRMANTPEPDLAEHLWTIAIARLILGPAMTIQAPPNLQPGKLAALLGAGVNDWGGVSPVTPDHVNPEAPWPHLDALRDATEASGRVLVERLAIGGAYALDADRWVDPALAPAIRRSIDARGWPIIEPWRAGGEVAPPMLLRSGETLASARIDDIVARARDGTRLDANDIITLLRVDGPDVERVAQAADQLRQETVGQTVTYVVNRNINYTNICLYRCTFCAFSKGGTKRERGSAYLLDPAEIGRRAKEAEARGATEVCLQGGIHPDFDGNTYAGILATVSTNAPSVHIHAFSPLEISHGARTSGKPLDVYLGELHKAGLATLPGTAAEILDDDVRRLICPDKLTSGEWLEVMRVAHAVGLRSTATIMFGHVDRYEHWARHLLAVRDLQAETGGFTEFVPLPFVHMGAPVWRRGQARSGPSFREALLMHAVARLALHPFIPNIQASWVKLGRDGVVQALRAGANDLGGVLMDESITRAAGGRNGQLCDARDMLMLAAAAGRPARQRTTLYGRVCDVVDETEEA